MLFFREAKDNIFHVCINKCLFLLINPVNNKRSFVVRITKKKQHSVRKRRVEKEIHNILCASYNVIECYAVARCLTTQKDKRTWKDTQRPLCRMREPHIFNAHFSMLTIK
jgi:thiamine kinase-like enzyme